MDAKDAAVRYLSRFARTERQVRTYLARKSYPKTEIDTAVAFLKEHDFLNDRSFLESFVQSRARRRDGPLKIKKKLFERGISGSIVDQSINQQYPIDRQIKDARALLERRSGKSTESQFRFLASRGFSRYVIMRALKGDA